MVILTLGVSAIFFAVGLILSWSKSAKGSAVVTFLLGLLGGGTSGIVFGGGHLNTGLNATPLDASQAGWLLLAIGLGTTGGLLVGTLMKLRAKKKGGDIVIGMAGPKIKPENKID